MQTIKAIFCNCVTKTLFNLFAAHVLKVTGYLDASKAWFRHIPDISQCRITHVGECGLDLSHK